VNQKQRTEIIENYYRASTAIMNIGTIEGIPKELENICINATRSTVKIIDFINDNKEVSKC